MKFYQHPASPNSRKVAMVAHLLNLSMKYEFVDLFAGAQKSAAYLAVNPNGLVPALADGSFVLWESNAIMKYLTARVPGQTLWPEGVQERAEVDRWLFWEQAHLASVTFRAARENLFKPMRGVRPDAAVAAEAAEGFCKLAAVLDASLAGREHIAGGCLSLADIALSCQLMFAGRTGLPLGQYAHLGRWFGSIRASEAWQSTEFSLEAPQA